MWRTYDSALALRCRKISYNSAHTMNIKAAWKYSIFTAGIAMTALVLFASPWSKSEPECFASGEQIVVRWKDMYWYPCKYSWRGTCVWPIRRKHITYKVTVNKGIPLRNEAGVPIAVAEGKIRTWVVYDATAWNGLVHQPRQKNRYPDYEPIADNEYVVLVETRYRLFHKVEANLRICTQESHD
jgi:hypothetical protein